MITTVTLEEGLSLNNELDNLLDELNQLPSLESLTGKVLSEEYVRTLSALRGEEVNISIEGIGADIWNNIKRVLAAIWKWITKTFNAIRNSSMRRTKQLNIVLKSLAGKTEEDFNVSMESFSNIFDSKSGFTWLRSLNALIIDNSWLNDIEQDLTKNVKIMSGLNEIGVSSTFNTRSNTTFLSYGTTPLSSDVVVGIKKALTPKDDNKWTLATFKKFVQSLTALQGLVSKIKFNSAVSQAKIKDLVENGNYASKDDGIAILTGRIKDIQNIVMLVIMMNNSMSNFALSFNTYLVKHIASGDKY